MISTRTFEIAEYRKLRAAAMANAATRLSLGALAAAGILKGRQDVQGPAWLSEQMQTCWVDCPWQLWALLFALLLVLTAKIAISNVSTLSGARALFGMGLALCVTMNYLLQDLLKAQGYCDLVWHHLPHLHYAFGFSVAVVCSLAHLLPSVQKENFYAD